MPLIYDAGSEERSLMLKRKALCNGEKTGRHCVYYWAHWEKVESNNPDSLRRGELFRVCLRSPSIAHEMAEHQVATECNQYKPMRLPILKRPLAALRIINDIGRFDPDFEGWQGMTPGEVKQLQDDYAEKYPMMDPQKRAETLAADLAKAKAEMEAEREISLDEAMDETKGDADQGIFED